MEWGSGPPLLQWAAGRSGGQQRVSAVVTRVCVCVCVCVGVCVCECVHMCILLLRADLNET